MDVHRCGAKQMVANVAGDWSRMFKVSVERLDRGFLHEGVVLPLPTGPRPVFAKVHKL